MNARTTLVKATVLAAMFTKQVSVGVSMERYKILVFVVHVKEY